jgi:hypothetical protein
MSFDFHSRFLYLFPSPVSLQGVVVSLLFVHNLIKNMLKHMVLSRPNAEGV